MKRRLVFALAAIATLLILSKTLPWLPGRIGLNQGTALILLALTFVLLFWARYYSRS